MACSQPTPVVRPILLILLGLPIFFAMIGASGCPLTPPVGGPGDGNGDGNGNDNGGAGLTMASQCAQCHQNIANKFTRSSHGTMANECVACHHNALEHMANPTTVAAKLDFSVSACGSCHAGQSDSYLHDDVAKAGHYGGSIPTSKYDEYPHYQYLMGGHGFTIEYNEERAHRYVLEDHIETQRRRVVTCLQCKSTPVAYYWNERHRGAVQYEKTQDWTEVIQRIRDEQPETIDYGAGCTHCHDPHDGGFRLIRKGVIGAILERGTDPYSTLHNVLPANEAELNALMNERGDDGKRTPRARRLAGTLTCGQCHIEYVCGQGADRLTTGEIRDDVSWRKLRDIEAYYQTKFNNQQDWKHSITGLTGVKPQHPELEAYWGSPHHMLGMSCADCHMAKTTNSDGSPLTSHWFTSPLKNNVSACTACHDDVKTELLAFQDAFYAKSRAVESKLNTVLQKIEAQNANLTIPPADLASAKSLYMRALTWWEWTAVSENSMGAHHGDEMNSQLDQAEEFADQANALLP